MKRREKKAKFQKGQKVEVINRHAGCAGSTGRVTAIERIMGHLYYCVAMTGGKGRGLSIRFTKNELVAV